MCTDKALVRSDIWIPRINALDRATWPDAPASCCSRARWQRLRGPFGSDGCNRPTWWTCLAGGRRLNRPTRLWRKVDRQLWSPLCETPAYSWFAPWFSRICAQDDGRNCVPPSRPDRTGRSTRSDVITCIAMAQTRYPWRTIGWSTARARGLQTFWSDEVERL